MTAFIQFPERPGDQAGPAEYREGFRDSVAPRLALDDTVILLEPDPVRANALREMWRETPNAVVLEAVGCLDDGCAGSVAVCIAGDADHPAATTTDARLAARFAPGEVLTHRLMPCVSPERAAAEHGQATIAVLSLDARITELASAAMTSAQEVSVVIAGCSRERIDGLRTWLSGSGLVPAGRAFGQAGTVMTYRAAQGLSDRAQAMAAQARVTIGQAVVAVRDAVPRDEHAAALRLRIRERLSGAKGGLLLDTHVGVALPPVRADEVDALVDAVYAHPEREWQVLAGRDDDPRRVSDECHARFGVRPISFSYPERFVQQLNPTPDLLVSPITPGFPYSFDDLSAYLHEYHRAHLAITHRKAGWDCFRHLEILAAGSTPLMPDAAEIPPFAMVHYPRATLAAIAAESWRGGHPDLRTREGLRRWFLQHLTTRAMADYLMESSGHGSAVRVLFIDERMPTDPEYLSTLTLIGLKERLGTGVEVAFPAGHVYADSPQPVSHFYGRGFGYLLAAEPATRTASEEAGVSGHGLAQLTDYDAIVIGSMSRNRALTDHLLANATAERIILIHGEDGAPNPEEAELLRRSGVHGFVRAVHRR